MKNYLEIQINLNSSSHSVIIGSGLTHNIGELAYPYLKSKKVFIVTDERVASLYLEIVKNSFEMNGVNCQSLCLPAGETTKSWRETISVVDWLNELKIERQDTVVALGGGVIGDLAGFCASIVRRGVSLIHIPTTLLAQVDSSVGGKTGINSAHGKNLIGTFHQPSLVISDTSLIKTMSRRDILSGYAEVVKYGLLGDEKFFSWLELNAKYLIKGDGEALATAVKISCEAKIRIVEGDEKEKGSRALLNLGHTFGHALEAATNYSDTLLHGEGVSLGCVLAFKFSEKLGLCKSSQLERVIKHFNSVGLNTSLSQIKGALPSSDKFIELMLNDKKVTGGSLNLILVRSIGDAFIMKNVNLEDLNEFLRQELG
ncbi:MAG: 3-dehydroquinate synthase [Pseudomonadota bacterium]|nr:3-dehydroquinate synthase [Pseudomonadota bacterium]